MMKNKTAYWLLGACLTTVLTAHAEDKKATDKASDNKAKTTAPVTLLYSSRPNQGSPDGKTGSPFADALLSALKAHKGDTSQQAMLTDIRKRYQDALTAEKITDTNSYLIDPWIDATAPMCGENATFVVTVGANDYPVGRLKNAVSDANKVEAALASHCQNAKMFSLRELAFSADSVFSFLKEMQALAGDKGKKQGNSLVFYYSGLGISDKGKQYLLSPRTQATGDAKGLKGIEESIQVSELEKTVANLGDNWRVTIFLDTGFPARD